MQEVTAKSDASLRLPLLHLVAMPNVMEVTARSTALLKTVSWAAMVETALSDSAKYLVAFLDVHEAIAL